MSWSSSRPDREAMINLFNRVLNQLSPEEAITLTELMGAMAELAKKKAMPALQAGYGRPGVRMDSTGIGAQPKPLSVAGPSVAARGTVKWFLPKR